MTTTRFATIVDSAYLPRGIVMIDSLREVAPDVAVDVLCMDAAARQGAGGVRAARRSSDRPRRARIVRPRARRRSRRPKHRGVLLDGEVVALSLPLRSGSTRRSDRLCGRRPHVLSLDPQPLFDDLADWSALVVPQHAPADEHWERTHGRFNAGFVAFRRSPETAAILRVVARAVPRVVLRPSRAGAVLRPEVPRRVAGRDSPVSGFLRNVARCLAPWNASRHRLSARDGDTCWTTCCPSCSSISSRWTSIAVSTGRLAGTPSPARPLSFALGPRFPVVVGVG